MDPWFSPRAVCSCFGEMIPKDQKTYPPRGEAGSRQKLKKGRICAKPNQGDWREEGPVPTHHVVATSEGHWEEVSMSHVSLSPTLPPFRAPRLSPIPIIPGTSERSLKAH